MPSLQALREFKTSFDQIGNEKAVLEARNLPFEDLPLPEVEAELPDTALEAAALDTLSQMGLDPSVAAALGLPESDASSGEPGAESPPGESALNGGAGALSPGDSGGEAAEGFPADPALGNFDLNALLDAIPDDLPDIPDEFPGVPDGENPAGDFPAGGPAEDSGVPSGLLDGLADDLEQTPGDMPDEGPGPEDADGLNLGDLGLDEDSGALGLGGGTEPAEPGPAEAETGGLDLGSLDDLNSLSDLGDLGLDEDSGTLDQGGDPESTGLDLDGLDENTAALDLGGETETGDLDLGENFSEQDLTGRDADPFDAFNMEGTPAIPEGDEEGLLDDSELGDFTLPGIDDMLGGIPGQASPASGKGKARRSIFGGPPPEEEEPEEIRLDESELARFQRTLAGYPLNLRVAVEEIIAEQAVPPDQMAGLVRLLTRGAPPKEAAALAGKILGRTIPVSRGFQKKTGEQLEAEQGSLAYIVVHRLLPVFRLLLFIALVAASASYLVWRFIYTPVRAEHIYQLGYDRITAGEYERANQRFTQAFTIHRDKEWFYRYAEAFRDQRQYIDAEQKYDELLSYYPRDKKGVLDYAAMETYYQRNYEKADRLLRQNLLDFNVNDREALLAQGDNALAWGAVDPGKYEDARFAYARLLERYGWTDPLAERMLRYFIRTDNLKEVLPLQAFFMDNPKKKVSAETLTELGGYLLDKRTEEDRGVPNAYVEQISGVRDLLLRAVLLGPSLPEAHYHLSRYYRNLGSRRDEQLTLEVALRAFDAAAEESVPRMVYHIQALKRDAELLIDRREYFTAEEQLVKAIGIYRNGQDRGLLTPAPAFGELYAAMGDLEYFTKSGDMEMTLTYYLNAEQTGYAPPEMLYRMGSAYYHREAWGPALERFFTASSQVPLNPRLLLALGNTCYQRQDYFAAQGYYNRLLDLLEAERSRLPVLLPNDRPEYIELAERLMIARNNMGVTLEALTKRTGNPRYGAQALNFYTQSAQAWNALTRNPLTMTRLGAGDLSSPGINLAYLNARNALYHQPGYEPQLFRWIDKDILEPSPWEN
jgi:tetratricopeptide (TPR) repeat protein